MSRRAKLLSALSVALIVTVGLIFWQHRSPSQNENIPNQYVTEVVPVTQDLFVPWQMQWMAPNSILFTELTGAIKMLDVATGAVKVLYQVEDLAREIQAGLMGLAVHPEFEETSSIYIAYNYYENEKLYLRVDALRFVEEGLVFEKTILNNIPSFPISIGGRLLISDDKKLFITVGEGSESETAQDGNSLQGKVLRYNLDGSIPLDNPFAGSPVWATGFRNPQGLAIGPAGIYASEHGTFSNDEINLIVKGGNYGWPLLSGICTNEPNCNGDGYIYPLTSYTPTLAPSGLTYYGADKYHFLQNSLLVACLKGQKIEVASLSADGKQLASSLSLSVGSLGRFRDVLVSPNGRIFASTSNRDVYGIPREGGDGIYELVPRDSFITEQKKYLSPPATITLDSTNLQVAVVAEGLRLPWELIWVRDQIIWFNERGGAIKELDLNTGKVRLIYQVEGVFESTDNSGMHAFTVHPDYPNKPFFYVHYTYELYKSRLQRFEVDPLTLEVKGNKILLPELEGNKSHNGSRLVFGPDKKLYFCIGDGYKRGAAQKLDRYNGKVLRLNDDGTIPDDNPYAGSHIWTLGHRNPQGLTWGSNGILYSSEHGSSDNDEINVLEKAGNYGFPKVQGFCDERSEQRFCEREQVKEPIHSWTPTVAPSGIDYYGHNEIPEWTNSLLITTLKSGDGLDGQRLLQAKLDYTGKRVEEINEFLTYSFGRLRDVMVTPDGRIFICTSNQESNQNAQKIVQSVDDRIIEIRTIEKIKDPVL